ncbi:MAG: CBS domain-containing protein [Nitrososphaera sp.]|uniref:CBS domain-containing protein n=1 Tax=Nitrososphaera sp. TaxID=1971748 RepID=UPI0017B46DE0|nr:CBS domain-containing protein [Nitrososphaera sp.]NWG36829.1 CBS domain-containing protein [Nitrososphaera sp.]
MQSDYLESRAADAAEEAVVLDESVTVAEAVKVMREKDVSSVFVSRKGEKIPVGIVTERDVLYRVVAANMGPFKITLKDVMSSPLVTVSDSATVRDAVTLMRSKGIRRLPVIRAGEMAGVITLKTVVGNIPSKSIELAHIEDKKAKTACPYCGSKFDDNEDLSKHIDRIHLGSGLLEGDLRQW